MLLIDSLMDEPLKEAVKNGQAPGLQYLLENGRYVPDMISPFPTMSVNVDSTLLTGVYSDRHKVPGLVWYNAKEKRIINYGSHIRELVKLGIKQSSRDVFYNLNQVHLSQQVKTLHEELDEKGIETCSINALLHRGAGTAIYRFPFFFNDFRIKPISQNQRTPAVLVWGFFQSESGKSLALQKIRF
ncbi:alkaline phosphatase family protein [Bacillus licheniformis]